LPRLPRWLLSALSLIVLLGWLSPELSNSDFWWHLKTGQYIWENHRLPVPDPFAFTTAGAAPAYPGEARTRVFNLTHEWLAQVCFYLVSRLAGWPGLILFRAIILSLFCAAAGWVAWRRTGQIYRGIACALAVGGVAESFAVDRPYIFTYLFLAVTVAILETGSVWIWLLPPLFVVWANCHGGFFLGWIAVLAYAVSKRDRRTWLAAAISIAASGLNPNGFSAPLILSAYRKSFMQSRLLEWAPPTLWPPAWPLILLAGGAATLWLARRKVRISDWLLFAAFTAAALAASRNEILIGFFAPIAIASYLPAWKRPLPHALEWAAGAALFIVLILGAFTGRFFQLRVTWWQFPTGAAEFLASHGIRERIFNTYEDGGYLIWRLWPQERVFIDGRALSDSVFLDYARILYNHDANGGKSAQQLLAQYGIDVIVMSGFEYVTGNVYLLAPALADPGQTEWKLVYGDAGGLVFMRRPPVEVQSIDSLRVLDYLEAGCELHIEHEPEYPRCARSLAQVFLKLGDATRGRKWIGTYLRLARVPDPEAQAAYQKLLRLPQ
jgi:hypothetical protein